MNKLFSVGLVIALLLGGIALFKSPKVQEVVGSAGPYSNVDFQSFAGGGEITLKTQNFQTSTSTLCAIPFPNATSTLLGVYVNPTVQDSTGGTLVIATSSTAYATTTPYFTSSATFKSQPVTFMATSTDATGSARYLKPSGGYVVVDVAGKTSYTFAGKCYAEFRSFK